MGADLDMKKVLIYIPTATGQQSSYFTEGFFYLLSDCWNNKVKGYSFHPKFGMRANINDTRNIACEMAREGKADYILFLDDDMVVFDNDLFTNLIKHDKDFVVPLFFQKQRPHMPCIFSEHKHGSGVYYKHITDYKKGLIEVDAAGFGCVLMKTEMLENMPEPFFEYKGGLGEDIYFCIKAKQAGYKLYCDTTLEVGHISAPSITTELSYEMFKGEAKALARRKERQNIINSRKYVVNEGIKDKKVDIIIACYKNVAITKDYIEDLYANTDKRKFNLILVNDGYDKDLDKYFKTIKYNNIKVINNEKALGWVGAINEGLKHKVSDYVIISNNDIRIVDTHWLQVMASKFDKDTGCVVPTSDYVMGIQSMAYNTHFMRMGLITHYAKIAIGFFMMLRSDVIDKIGGLDERFGLGGNDDLDYSIRIRKAGYKIKVARDVFINHIGSQSIPLVCDIKALDDKTREILIEKWGKKEVEDLFITEENFLRFGE